MVSAQGGWIWLGGQDSNLDRRRQRPLSYRLDDPRTELGNLIVYGLKVEG